MAWLRRQLEVFQRALWPFVGRVPPTGARRQWDEPSFFGELARRLEILGHVNEVLHLRLPEASVDQRPSVPLAALSDLDARDQFVALLDWFGGAVTSA